MRIAAWFEASAGLADPMVGLPSVPLGPSRSHLMVQGL